MDELRLIFLGSDNRQHTLIVQNFDPALTAEKVSNIMNQLVASNVVSREDAAYYVQPIRAVVVQTTTRVLYEREA